MDKDSFLLIAYYQKKLHLEEQRKLQDEIQMLKQLILDHTDLQKCSKCLTYDTDNYSCDICTRLVCKYCAEKSPYDDEEVETCVYCFSYHCVVHLETCCLCEARICSHCIDEDVHSCNGISDSDKDVHNCNDISDSVSDSDVE